MPGEGSVFRRQDGRWVATVSQGPRTGRKVTTVYRHSRPEALDALAELRRNAGRLDSRTLMVSTYLERWLRDADIRDTTRRGYQAVIATHLKPAIGHLRLVALSPAHVSRLMADLRGTMAPKTARNILVMLRRALREAVRKELVSRNVASPEYVDAPKIAAYDPDALTAAELDALFAVLAGDPIEAHVVTALGTGLRQGEQLALRWDDLRGEAIRVEYELARIDGQYRHVPPKTDRSRRTVPVTTTVRAALERHKAALRAAGLVPVGTGPVFPNTTGGALSGAVLTHRWYALQAKAGIRRRPWKILRATFGSQLYAQGFDDLAIATLMGHARTHTTRRHYIASGAVDAREAIETMLTRTVTRTESVAGRG